MTDQVHALEPGLPQASLATVVEKATPPKVEKATPKESSENYECDSGGEYLSDFSLMFD